MVVFDPATIADQATFEKPHQYAVGMRHVLVNGVPVLRDGEHTGATPGRALKGPGARGAAGPLERVPRLAVTGANGFVGRHVIVRGARRRAGTSRASCARQTAARDRRAMPAARPSWSRASTAERAGPGPRRRGGGRPPGPDRLREQGETYEAVNVEGTRRGGARPRARPASRASCYFSGLGVAHYGMAPRTTDRYFLSKLRAEAALFRVRPARSSSSGRPTSSGPRRRPRAALLRQMAAGEVEQVGDGRYRMQPVAVRDAAAAVLAAVGRPTPGPARRPRPHRVIDLVGRSRSRFHEFVGAPSRRAARAHGAAAEFRVRTLAGRGGGPPARAGGYRGMQPDELDCLLCDEVADPRPLEALLGRF